VRRTWMISGLVALLSSATLVISTNAATAETSRTAGVATPYAPSSNAPSFATPTVRAGATKTFTAPASDAECLAWRTASQKSATAACPGNKVTLSVSKPRLATPAEQERLMIPVTKCGNHTCPVTLYDSYLDECSNAGCWAWKMHLENTWYADTVWVWANKWGYYGAWKKATGSGICSFGAHDAYWYNNPSKSWIQAAVDFRVDCSVNTGVASGDHFMRIYQYPNGTARGQVG
jgi:hypothetical protein